MIANVGRNGQLLLDLVMWKLVHIISNPYGFILDNEAFLVGSKIGIFLIFKRHRKNWRMITKVDKNSLGMWKLVCITSNPYGFILDLEAFLV